MREKLHKKENSVIGMPVILVRRIQEKEEERELTNKKLKNFQNKALGTKEKLKQKRKEHTKKMKARASIRAREEAGK